VLRSLEKEVLMSLEIYVLGYRNRCVGISRNISVKLFLEIYPLSCF